MNDNNRQDLDLTDEGVTLKELVGIVFKYRFIVLLIVSIFVVLSSIYLFKKEPVYEASGLILIENPHSSFLMNDTFDISIPRSSVVLNTAVERIKG